MRENLLFNRLKEIFVGIAKDKQSSSSSSITAKVVKETPLPKTSISEDWTEQVDVSMYFPLHQGDIVELRSGKKYQICKKTITGAIENTSVTLLWVNKPTLIQEQDRVEQIRFKSLRELNYHLQQEKSSIVRVKKSYLYKKEPELSIDEAHELAIEENKKRERVKQFFNNLPSKK